MFMCEVKVLPDGQWDEVQEVVPYPTGAGGKQSYLVE